MTYREKLAIEYPDMIDEDFFGGCYGCPSGYGYGPECVGTKTCLAFPDRNTDAICAACWDQEMPKERKS